MFWGQEEVDFLIDLGWKCNRCGHHFGVFHCHYCQKIIEKTLWLVFNAFAQQSGWYVMMKTLKNMPIFCKAYHHHIQTPGMRAFSTALGLCLRRQEIFVTLGIMDVFFLKKKSSFHCHYYQSNPAPPDQLHISLVVLVTFLTLDICAHPHQRHSGLLE